jgi:hypothetical protein
MRPRGSGALAGLVLLLTFPPLARADGAYGRLDGDLAPSVEAGAVLGPRAAAPAAQGRLLYLDTAGLQATWFGASPRRPWSASLGAELRPLFLPRFLKNREQGPARWDLLLDSLHLGLAARLGPERRPGLDLSLGLEIPLSASYAGFFLGARLLRHWPHDAFHLGHGRPESLAFLSLGLRGVWGAHLVDLRDQVLR